MIKESVTVTVDDQGRKDIHAALADLFERAEEIHRECRERGASERVQLVTLQTNARRTAPSPSEAKSSTASNP